MAHQEWPLIKRDIGNGIPSPMFVQTVKSSNPAHLGDCHQVLADAYDVSGRDITLPADARVTMEAVAPDPRLAEARADVADVAGMPEPWPVGSPFSLALAWVSVGG